jgi:hypothetical protein
VSVTFDVPLKFSNIMETTENFRSSGSGSESGFGGAVGED